MTCSSPIPIPGSSSSHTAAGSFGSCGSFLNDFVLVSPAHKTSMQPQSPLSPSTFVLIEGSPEDSFSIFNWNSMEFLSRARDVLNSIGKVCAGDFAVINPEDLNVTIYNPSQFVDFRCPLFSTLSAPTIGQYNPSVILRTLKMILDRMEKDIRVLKEQQDGKEKNVELILLNIKDALIQGEKGLTRYKLTCQQYITLTVDEQFDQLITDIQSLIRLLPEDKIKVAIGESKEVVEKSFGLLYESDDPADIDWKISRYKSVLNQVKTHVKETYKKVFMDLSNASGSLLSSHQNSAQDSILKLVSLFESLDTQEEPSQAYLTSLRLTYCTYINHLRDTVAVSVDADGKVIPGMETIDLFATRLAEAHYTAVSLATESVYVVQKFSQWGRRSSPLDPKMLDKEHAELLKPTYTNIHNAPTNALSPFLRKVGKSVLKHWNLNFDPAMQSNLSELKGTFAVQGGKEVKLIAFGTPTYEGFAAYAQVTPEFFAFIRSYKNQKKSHLYVIHQDMRHAMQNLYFGGLLERMRGGVEHDRINVILKVAEMEEYRGALYCIVLSKNSSFYYQTGEFSDRDDAGTFLNELIVQHFDLPGHQSGNHFPRYVFDKIPNLKEISIAVRDRIWELFFAKKTTLTKEEREIFIELFQDEVVRIITLKFNNDSLSFGCKDTADRSANSIARFVANLFIAQKMHQQEGFFELIETLLYSRALMVCKRDPFEHRVDRAIKEINFMLQHVDQLIDLQQKGPAPYTTVPHFDLGVPSDA